MEVDVVGVEESEERESLAGEQIPEVGMTFDYEERLYNFYKKYAFDAGFGIRKVSTKTEGEVKYYTLACSRGGILLNKNFHSLVVEAKGYDNLQFGEKDYINYIAKVRQLKLVVGDAEALRNYFTRMQRRNSNFFYDIDMDDAGHLRNGFLGRCKVKGSL
ncbi:uncharacterized protein LOC130711324 [Lotus japonicus]|uniref:uncharacterized protein LOC130711324 n=1 Tax=Lotus japonicus TaxID=34305 RepID=UPI002585D4C9|nr:uncharacterized protein LOC130711324 [Lotus japonicus]